MFQLYLVGREEARQRAREAPVMQRKQPVPEPRSWNRLSTFEEWRHCWENVLSEEGQWWQMSLRELADACLGFGLYSQGGREPLKGVKQSLAVLWRLDLGGDCGRWQKVRSRRLVTGFIAFSQVSRQMMAWGGMLGVQTEESGKLG